MGEEVCGLRTTDERREHSLATDVAGRLSGCASRYQTIQAVRLARFWQLREHGVRDLPCVAAVREQQARLASSPILSQLEGLSD